MNTGTKPKFRRQQTTSKECDDWKSCQEWMLQLKTASSAKIPSLDKLRDEHDLYLYLKVKFVKLEIYSRCTIYIYNLSLGWN